MLMRGVYVQVWYHDTNGNTPGILMSQDLWA